MSEVDGPRFSVVVPTYNRPEFLRECLASVRAQTIEDFECIVVDDGSNTAEPVMPDDERFRLLALETNHGVTHARQFGCDEARGEFLAFLDDDEYESPGVVYIGQKHPGMWMATVRFSEVRRNCEESRDGRYRVLRI